MYQSHKWHTIALQIKLKMIYAISVQASYTQGQAHVG